VAIAAGIGLSLVAFALYTSNDIVVKWVSGTYPLHQILFFNTVTGLGVFLAAVAVRRDFINLRTRRLGLHILRSLIGLCGGFGAYYAYKNLPLADAYALIFAAPLFVTALSVPVLQEQVGWRRWSAVLVGFVGVVVMLRPGAGVLEVAAFGALLGALAHAISVMMIRRLGQTESSYSYGVYGNVTNLCVTAVLCLTLGWVEPKLEDLVLLGGGGVLAAIGFLCVIAAYRRAPAAVVAPFHYTQIIWGTLAGYLIWHHVPDRITLIGAGIVASSGLYILHREVVRRREKVAVQPPETTAPSAPPNERKV